MVLTPVTCDNRERDMPALEDNHTHDGDDKAHRYDYEVFWCHLATYLPELLNTIIA